MASTYCTTLKDWGIWDGTDVYSISTRRSPASHFILGVANTLFTLPAVGLSTTISIFIALSTTRGSADSTMTTTNVTSQPNHSSTFHLHCVSRFHSDLEYFTRHWSSNGAFHSRQGLGVDRDVLEIITMLLSTVKCRRVTDPLTFDASLS